MSLNKQVILVTMLSISAIAGLPSSVSTALADPPARTSPRISMQDARARALERVPGTVLHEELEKEDGRWIYSFEIRPQGVKEGEKEVNVDADTGTIVAVEDDTDEDSDSDTDEKEKQD